MGAARHASRTAAPAEPVAPNKRIFIREEFATKDAGRSNEKRSFGSEIAEPRQAERSFVDFNRLNCSKGFTGRPRRLNLFRRKGEFSSEQDFAGIRNDRSREVNAAEETYAGRGQAGSCYPLMYVAAIKTIGSP